MADTERDTQDDLEVKITDLDPTFKRNIRWRWRLTPGQRHWSVVVTSVVFLLLMGLFLGSISEVRGLLARAIFRPAPPIPVNGMPVYLQSNPSWGQFRIDGKPVAHLPVVGRGTPLALSFGTHSITWQAAPFPSRTCVFTVKDAATINSPCLHNGKASVNFAAGSYAVLAFFAAADDLPPGEYAALIQQLQMMMAAYGGSEQVRPGELYAISEPQIAANPTLCTVLTRAAICAARAAQPLQATLRVQLDSSVPLIDPCALAAGQCFVSGPTCKIICTDAYYFFYGYYPGANSDLPLPQGWVASVGINLSWSYTTLSGQTVARDQPATAIRGATSSQSIGVQITRSGQRWQIVPSLNDFNVGADHPLCLQAEGDMGVLVSSSSDNQQISPRQVGDLRGNAVAGCLVVLNPDAGIALNPSTPISGTSSSQVAYCLVRFGVPLMVNHFAQQSWPFLPLVDSYENSLSQQLIATLPPLT